MTRGTMRNGKGGTHRPKVPPPSSGLTPEQLTKRLSTLRTAIKSSEDYIVKELRRLRKTEGNGAEVSKLVKFLYEVRREAHAESQRVGAAEASVRAPRDFLGSGVAPPPE